MSTVGEQPGRGVYVCDECGQAIFINDDAETLPPCPRCSGTEYTPEPPVEAQCCS